VASSFYDSDRRDWVGGKANADRKLRIARFGICGGLAREVRLSVYRGRLEQVWWLRLAPGGVPLDVSPAGSPPCPEDLDLRDPEKLLASVLDQLGEGLSGVVEPVARVVVAPPRGPVSASGSVDRQRWECEIDRYGLVRVTGAGADEIADGLAHADDVVDWLRAISPDDLTEGWVMTPGAVVGKYSPLGTEPSAFRAQPPVLPAKQLHEGVPVAVVPPGREVVLSSHERGSTNASVWIGADGTVLGGFGLGSVADVLETPDGRRLRFAEAPEEWLRYNVEKYDDSDFWVAVQEVVRRQIPAPGVQIAAQLGAYFLEFARIGVTASGQVTITGGYSAEVGALLDAKFDEEPFGWLRQLPERLVAGGIDAFRPQRDHLLITRRADV
jgi:hypothetical protein